ncbi:MAG: DUF2950 family protein [Bryobacteraceae bacterium]
MAAGGEQEEVRPIFTSRQPRVACCPFFTANRSSCCGRPKSLLLASCTQAVSLGWYTGICAPFFGYYYRVLTAQGKNAAGGSRNFLVDGHLLSGFGLVAWPAEYGETGVSTFIVNQLGQVYEKDLGARTSELVKAITQFDPD